jgi:hypothetical protein
VAYCLDVARDRRILSQREVSANLVVVFLIRNEQVTEVLLAKDNNMIKTIPSD